MSNWANEGAKPVPGCLNAILMAIGIALVIAVLVGIGDDANDPDPSPSTSSLGRLSVQAQKHTHRLGAGFPANQAGPVFWRDGNDGA